ncbi:MAG TPA: hypothetical protein VKN63_05465 [Afifellaceae bacterium]|nr:hypothetical protein [Afifellaceae bacterium]
MFYDRRKSWNLFLSHLISLAVVAFIVMLITVGMFDRFLVH